MGEPWYAEGLRFQCQWRTCRACCTGAPGYVWVDDDDIARLAEFLGETPRGLADRAVVEVYERPYPNGQPGRSLIERDNGDCIFLGPEGTGCTVYAVRPAQCRSYPFWPEMLESPGAWEREATYCPGIGKGPVVSREDIDARANRKAEHAPPW